MNMMEILLHAGQLGLSPKEVPLDRFSLFLGDFAQSPMQIQDGVLTNDKQAIVAAK